MTDRRAPRHNPSEDQVAKVIASMERAYSAGSPKSPIRPSFPDTLSETWINAVSNVDLGIKYSALRSFLDAQSLRVDFIHSLSNLPLPRESKPSDEVDRVRPMTAAEFAYSPTQADVPTDAARPSSASGERLVEFVRSGHERELEADVYRYLVGRFGDTVDSWLTAASGPNGRSILLGDLEYVVRRLDRILNPGLILNWLTSFNERLNTTPVEALALRYVGDVLAAMDAEDQGSY